jgi:hypothetical protein
MSLTRMNSCLFVNVTADNCLKEVFKLNPSQHWALISKLAQRARRSISALNPPKVQLKTLRILTLRGTD